MYALLKPLLFCLNAEQAHHLTLTSIKLAHRCGLLNKLLPTVPAGQPVQIMGLSIPNPVGLAAGLDKNGAYIDSLAALGFGFIEIGTVTPRPQDGNPKPRLFRLPQQQAIINRMGFNNQGVDALIRHVENSRFKGVLGINIGKNATTPIEQAADDYLTCLEKTYPYASYITINISSPNTKNLRSLQSKDELHALIDCLKNKQAQLATEHGRYVPLAVKIAPDLTAEQAEIIANVALQTEIDGIIATNTTIDKSSLGNHPLAQEAGGLSGLPVRQQSDAILAQLSALLGERIALIGVGGISSGCDAATKLKLGAQAVQVYSGLIFQGPELIHDCIRACAAKPSYQ